MSPTTTNSAKISLRVFGDFHVTVPDGTIPLPQSRKTRALLAYLACTGRQHRRERLCEMFWEIPDDPRGALRWSLSKIRQVVGPALEADRNCVRLVPGSFALELSDLRAVCAQPLDEVSLDRLDELARCFRGSFLSDMYLPRCPEFEAWRTAIADECEVARIGLLRHLIGRLADQPRRALVHAHALQELLPDDDGLAGEIVRLRQAARETAGAPPSVAPSPVDGSEPAAPALPMAVDLAAGVSPRDMASKLRATVLAVDLVSPVQIFELVDPEATAQQFGPVYDDIADISTRYGGMVLELGNGQALLGFGVSPASEDHALLACRAALELGQRIRLRTDGSVRMRAAIDTGDVILQHRGPAMTALSGAAPRQARRLAHALKRDAIVISGRTRVSVGGYVRTERFDHANMTGIGRDEEFWQLTRENKALSRWHLRLHHATLPMLAREAEMFSLHAAWRRARSGAGQVVAVSGEAGLGKSRLVHEFCDSVAAEGAYLIESGGLETDRTVDFGLIRALVAGLCGLSAPMGEHDAAARLATVASELRIEPWHLPALTFLLGEPDGEYPWRQHATDEKVRRVGEAVRSLAVAMARRAPIILLVEDLHWADLASEAVLARLVDAATVAPILLIATYRPHYVAGWQGRAHCQQIRVCRFTPSECAEAVEAALGSHPSTASLRCAIARQCDGSPLFIDEAVRTLREDGRISGTPGDYLCTEELDLIEIPSTIQGLIEARIVRLPGRDRQFLQTAALASGEIHAEVLRAAAELSHADFAAAAAALTSAELLQEVSGYPETSYSVVSPLVRQVAVDMLLVADRDAMTGRLQASAGTARRLSPEAERPVELARAS